MKNLRIKGEGVDDASFKVDLEPKDEKYKTIVPIEYGKETNL